MERDGKTRTKTHGLALEVAGLQSVAHLLLAPIAAYQVWHTPGLTNPTQRSAISFIGDRELFLLNRTICICIYLDMTKPTTFALPCMCASFRRASRTLTRHYDTALRPLGLRARPFTLLQALSKSGEVSQSTLGEIRTIDSTTLTRTLAIMGRRGWIASRSGEDRREGGTL